MGIKDLLRFIKPYIQIIHIKKYAGKRVGIDAYSWLHKGAYSCSMELCMNSNSERRLKYIDYFMHRIHMLQHHEITPVVVFDGGNVPCKAATGDERHRRRKKFHDLAMEKVEEGNVRAATELFQRAVSVTPSMAHELIKILRSENIEFVVAPYEADAQLAYLASLEAEKGGIAAVITEDSDLVAYGCQAIIFKMDQFGNGDELLLDNVFNQVDRTPSFQNFDLELFTGMCVLAGCDFLPSVPGIGIGKAYALVSKYQNLDRALSVLKLQKGNQMPEDYPRSFREAAAVFQHAQVYDSDKKIVKHMRPIPQELVESLDGELDFLGPEIPSSIAIAIAEGKLDPISMEAFDHFPSSSSRHRSDPIKSQITHHFQRSETATVSAQVSSFVAFSHKTRKQDITTPTEKQNPVLDEKKYLNEAAALGKLIIPSTKNEVTESTTAPNNIPLKARASNPFKKRKQETNLDQIGSNTRQVSIASDVEILDSLCASTSNVSSIVIDDSPRKRKNDIHLDDIESESSQEQVSVVTSTQIKSSESQESVNSKLSKQKRMVKNDKLKRNSCSTNKKGSILNFYSPV
ncbi:putative exodeoxyribonuclease I [Rosa chinensis]|uniref:Exonuclease 1 n=1 Tax=Rosa chinensis TaxID=74649 RepID=A0A2P6P1X3_ROSCH|nr:exonuclease 1 [Rosa chinensis]PRQ15932.1 putative exodeoxyribonuclease I [Rosa chinensis]